MSEVAEAVDAKELTGVVENIKPYGVFMALSDGRNGLLHISQLDVPRSTDAMKFFELNYAKGSEHKIEVQKVENGKVSLCLPGKAEDARKSAQALKKIQKEGKSESFGNLGGIFDGLNL